MRGAVLVWLIAGCDGLFGISEFPHDPSAKPLCTPQPFDGITPAALPGKLEDFTMPEDRSFAVTVYSGLAAERDTQTGVSTPIDLGIYPTMAPSLSPEGDVLMYTPSIEPWQIGTMRRVSPGHWQPDDAPAPPAALAGAPSSARFGPRHVLALVDIGGTSIQEFVEAPMGWTAVGPVYTQAEFGGATMFMLSPNLMPDALTLVYQRKDNFSQQTAIWYAQRASMDVPFALATGGPILMGERRSPHLSDDCKQLYVMEGAPGGSGAQQLVRYDL